MVSAFLAGCVFLVLYALLIAVFPMHRCPRCHGERVIRSRRIRTCPKCKATGRAMRPGATLLHRLLQEHIGPAVRGRIRPIQDDSDQEKQP